jgi:hypothetical protein
LNCKKCGAQVPEGSGFCGSCGATVDTGSSDKVQNQASQWWASTSALLKRDPAVLIVGIGSLLLCLGAFLSWEDNGRFPDVLGLQEAAGPVVLTLGALLILALVLARGGTPGAWSVVMLVLSVVALVLIFQTMIWIDDHDANTGAGLYVAMVGGLSTATGGVLEMMRILKK